MRVTLGALLDLLLQAERLAARSPETHYPEAPAPRDVRVTRDEFVALGMAARRVREQLVREAYVDVIAGAWQ